MPCARGTNNCCSVSDDRPEGVPTHFVNRMTITKRRAATERETSMVMNKPFCRLKVAELRMLTSKFLEIQLSILDHRDNGEITNTATPQVWSTSIQALRLVPAFSANKDTCALYLWSYVSYQSRMIRVTRPTYRMGKPVKIPSSSSSFHSSTCVRFEKWIRYLACSGCRIWTPQICT